MLYVVYVKVLKLTKQKQEEFYNTPPKTHLKCVDVAPPCPCKLVLNDIPKIWTKLLVKLARRIYEGSRLGM